MATYHYKDSPLIDRIEVKSPRPGIAHATIFVKDHIGADELEKLRVQLGKDNFSTLMDSVDGHATIQVRGLKDEKPLLASLGKLGLIKGKVEIDTVAGDYKKQNFRERVRGKSLFLSALFYDLGNISYFVSGIQRGRHNKNGKFTPNDVSEIMIGAAFSVGDILMTMYGGDKGDEELSAAAMGLKRHLHKKGIQIPDGNELNPDTLNRSGALKATDRWLRKHIIQVKCLTEFVGGLFTIHAGLKPGNRNNGKLLAGFLISTAWLSTLLLEKPQGHAIFDGDKDDDSSPTAIEAMANNPRGWIARPMAMANNVANLWGSLGPKTGERARFGNEVLEAQRKLAAHNTAENRAHLTYTQVKQHDYMWNVITACSFLVAHTLFGISGSKRPRETEDDKRMMDDLVLLSANVLAKQPEPIRQQAIEDTADYVSKLAHVDLEKEQVADAIRNKIEGITHSSWAARIQASPATASPQMSA